MMPQKVLVVDDEAEFGKYVGQVARDLGLGVEVTSSGRQFMAALPRFRPDVVVMDMVMPEIEGIELIRWLAQWQYPVRLVVVTGHNPIYAKMAAQMAQAGGLRDVTTLSKPVPLDQLRSTLLAE